MTANPLTALSCGLLLAVTPFRVGCDCGGVADGTGGSSGGAGGVSGGTGGLSGGAGGGSGGSGAAGGSGATGGGGGSSGGVGGASGGPDGGVLELKLADRSTGSTGNTTQRSVDVRIAGDSQASWWCLSESRTNAGSDCFGGAGSDRGGYRARPTTFTLSPGDGPKRVFLRLEPSGEAEASITVAGSPPPIGFHRLPEVVSFSRESATRLSGRCTEVGGLVEISGSVSGNTGCQSDGGWAITLDYSSKPDGPLVVFGTQRNVAMTLASSPVAKPLRKDTAVCRPAANRAAAPFAQGSGDAGDPYAVCTPTQLMRLSVLPFANDHVILRDDLDLTDSGVVSGFSFGGTFDGRGFTVSGLSIQVPSAGQGLFTDLRGTIRDLSVENADVRAGGYSGALVGIAEAGSQVIDCHSSGRVEVSGDHAGGLIGSNHGDVTDCSSTATVVANSGTAMGGLMGHHYAPGLVRRSFAKGVVSGHCAGGLIGRIEGVVQDSYATGSVSTAGQQCAGGLTGELLTPHGIFRTFSTGFVENAPQSGGLVGLLGLGTEVDASYWNIDSSGRMDSSGGIGLTMAQMRDAGSFVGWDFNAVWRLAPERAPHPELRWQP